MLDRISVLDVKHNVDRTSLRTLRITEAPAQIKADAKEQRRQKLVAQLEQQKHMVIDPAYSIIQAKWTKDETGNRVKTETAKRLRRWWHKVGQDAHAERSVERRTWKVVWSAPLLLGFPRWRTGLGRCSRPFDQLTAYGDKAWVKSPSGSRCVKRG